MTLNTESSFQTKQWMFFIAIIFTEYLTENYYKKGQERDSKDKTLKNFIIHI